MILPRPAAFIPVVLVPKDADGAAWVEAEYDGETEDFYRVRDIPRLGSQDEFATEVAMIGTIRAPAEI